MKSENEAALREFRPDLLPRLREAERAGEWRVETGERGALILAGAEGPRTSRYDPAREAEREAKDLSGGREAIQVVMGFGLGDLPRRALATGPERLLCYEPSPSALAAALAAVSAEDLLRDTRFVLLAGSGDEEADIFLVTSQMEASIDPLRSHRLETASLPALRDLGARIFPRLQEAWMRTFGDILTSFGQEALWFENSVRNLRTLPRILPKRDRPLAGSGAILVGAGPSLSRNIDLLREAKGRVPIVAVDTALRALAGRGILPEIAVCVDANPENETDLEGLPPEVFRETILAADIVSAPRFFKDFERVFAHRTRNYCLGPDGIPVEKPMGVAWMLDRIRPEIPSWQSGGSVSTNALSLLVQWGADPIILVGQDLAYPGGATHAADVGYEEAGFARAGRFSTRETASARNLRKANFRVPAWGGRGEVATGRILYSYLRWFEATRAQGFGRGKTWIDATEGGARKVGFLEMPLAEALRSLPATDVEERLARIRILDRMTEEELRSGLAGLAGEMRAAGGMGAALLERARAGLAGPGEIDGLVEELRRSAFLLEGLGMKHLRAAFRENDTGTRAALVGRIFEEVSMYVVAKLEGT